MTDRTDRLMIFIDGSNLYHSLKGFFKRTDIDIGKFCQKLLDRRRLIRIYYYNARVGRQEEPERYQHQQAFFHSVKNNYDVAILVAGDSDYVGALQAVKDNGKNVEVALFGKERTSRPLREVADVVIAMDGRFLRGCW